MEVDNKYLIGSTFWNSTQPNKAFYGTLGDWYSTLFMKMEDGLTSLMNCHAYIQGLTPTELEGEFLRYKKKLICNKTNAVIINKLITYNHINVLYELQIVIDDTVDSKIYLFEGDYFYTVNIIENNN